MMVIMIKRIIIHIVADVFNFLGAKLHNVLSTAFSEGTEKLKKMHASYLAISHKIKEIFDVYREILPLSGVYFIIR